MDQLWKDGLWNQFGATIDMLDQALKACPDELWTASLWKAPESAPGLSEFWYIAYHTLFWLDLYLSGAVEGFAPPAPYNLDELDPRGVIPERVYTRQEMLSYLAHCRQKCRATIEGLTDEKVHQVCVFTWKPNGFSFAELTLNNMRHVQDHCAQLNMFLGQQTGLETGWFNQPKDDH